MWYMFFMWLNSVTQLKTFIPKETLIYTPMEIKSPGSATAAEWRSILKTYGCQEALNFVPQNRSKFTIWISKIHNFLERGNAHPRGNGDTPGPPKVHSFTLIVWRLCRNISVCEGLNHWSYPGFTAMTLSFSILSNMYYCITFQFTPVRPVSDQWSRLQLIVLLDLNLLLWKHLLETLQQKQLPA